ncbi:hypothetical protein NW768_002798 [Fusarium equiseti]|uniref:Uncharacterized protein n=1 Tax=Fusarium equiseti TaxID=61235 RepID=A0ABQ8RKE3_FUSEQ|nr:hypothetical protein NW768_002798 [Fusarium equiseti]
MSSVTSTTESTIPERTTKPREDHVLWTCKHLKGLLGDSHCNKLNGMLDKKCLRCKAKRDVNAVAVSRTRKDIGKLIGQSPEGLEIWEYDDDKATSL